MTRLALAFCLLASTALAQSISGPASVIDGDTIEVSGQRIRLWGIDAPEIGQQCGKKQCLGPDCWVVNNWSCGVAAEYHLIKLLWNYSRITCGQKSTDKYGRVVAICYAGKTELNRAMVAAGWATDYTRYSHGYYQTEQEAARKAQSGLWGLESFQEPEEWRREHRR